MQRMWLSSTHVLILFQRWEVPSGATIPDPHRRRPTFLSWTHLLPSTLSMTMMKVFVSQSELWATCAMLRLVLIVGLVSPYPVLLIIHTLSPIPFSLAVRSPPPTVAMTSPPPSASSARSPTSPTSSTRAHPPQQSDNTGTPDFVSRVSHIPLVNSALRVYEQGKASSRVVKV